MKNEFSNKKSPAEPSKSRCPVSHPLFEEFRMLSFVNSIKYKDVTGKFVFISKEQKNIIKQLFLRKIDHFDFEDIRKTVSKKNEELYFNYKDYTLVSSLSLCAIRKILPYLEEGLLYSHSV